MEAFNNILVGLDFSKSDKTVLKHAKALVSILSPEKVTFVNVHQEVSVPAEILLEFPNLVKNIDDHYLEKMVQELIPLGLLDTKVEFKALTGNPIQEIVKLIRNNEFDLLIVGKKNGLVRENVSHRKLIRKVPCSVLVIPDNASTDYKKVIAPTDFSEYSQKALEQAQAIVNNNEGQLICEHIYEVPTGFYTTGKTHEDFAEIMRINAVQNYKQFAKEISLGDTVVPDFTLNDETDIGDTLLKIAEKKDVNLLVVGAKGKGNLEATLMGSVSESLLERTHDIPLLIIKEGNHHFSFWKDLYGILSE
ncbi:MAG: universal stress protein [Cytophagales bacterium]|nr:universal stress protein [Cytophagales bacterium]